MISTSEFERACLLQILALEEQLKHRHLCVVVIKDCILHFFGHFRTLVNRSPVSLFANDRMSLANGANLDDRIAIHAVNVTDAAARLSKMKDVDMSTGVIH